MRTAFAAMVTAACLLAGCGKPDQGAFGATHQGRYAGVGHFAPGPMWSQVVRADAQGDPAAARTDDDEQVIIVIDSTTGELRQCGNLSGYCVGMNPWSKPLASKQTTPLHLAKHSDQLGGEAAAKTDPP